MIEAPKKAVATLLLLLLSQPFLLAQEEVDFMRSMGKMYVVVAVIVAIFLGIVVYLISLDRKLTKLENQIIDNE